MAFTFLVLVAARGQGVDDQYAGISGRNKKGQQQDNDDDKYTVQWHKNVLYLVVYTDGSTVHPQSSILARSGWAIHFARGSQHNDSGGLAGPAQSTYRAELRAAVHVIQHARTPVWIKTDYKSVATTLRDLTRSNPNPVTLDKISEGRIAERRAATEEHRHPDPVRSELASTTIDAGGRNP